MYSRSRKRRVVRIPTQTTQKAITKDYEYTKGWNSNDTNDDVPADQFRLIIDAREPQVGKWETRKGNELFSIPIGETVNVEQASTTGGADVSFNGSTWWAKKCVATASGPTTAIEARLKNDADATGTVMLALYTDESGAPGTELFRTSVASSTITSSYAYLKGRSITCPEITSGATYWVVGFVQTGGTGSYKISSTTNASTGLISSNSGVSWATASADFNVKLSSATTGPVKGHIRVRKSNGTNYTFLVHGNTLYSVNESTGVTSVIDTGLNASATFCRFAFVNDVLYYVTGLQKPRQYNFTTASEVSTAPENASAIVEHKGVVFYLSADDTTKMFYTNFAQYSTFTSTDLIYIPAPRTADPATAFFKLNGVLYICTQRNKHVLYGSENQTFRLDNAIGQKGTFSQDSVVTDEDNAYLASSDGIFRFNGAEEVNIAKDILKDYQALLSKSSIVLDLHENRLYVWFTPNGGSGNSKCWVYNTLYRIWESEDTLGFVAKSYARDADAYFLQGSNRCGMLMRADVDSNENNSMGEPLSFELNTAYVHYDAPAQFKRAPYFRPHFDTVSGTYSVQVGYATDYSDVPTYDDISLAGSGPRFNTGVLFDSGAVFGGSSQVNPLDDGINIPGEWRRLQLRYKHYASREPVSFDGHVLAIEIQRLI